MCPLVCPGLFQTSFSEPFPDTALDLGFSIYLSAHQSSSYDIKYTREDKDIGHDEYTLRRKKPIVPEQFLLQLVAAHTLKTFSLQDQY